MSTTDRNPKEIRMTIAEDGRTQIRYARLAGFMYLFLIAVYLVGAMISSRFEVPGNVVETAHRIVSNELLFRFGLALGSLNALCAVLLAVSLYVAVRVVDKNLALLALAFELVYAAVGAAANLIDYAFLKQQMDAYSSGILDVKQLTSLADFHSSLDTAGLNIACILYGAGSFREFLRHWDCLGQSWCRSPVLRPSFFRIHPSCCKSAGCPSLWRKFLSACGC
jgi:Flp pilus assembly pilin Flp